MTALTNFHQKLVSAGDFLKHFLLFFMRFYWGAAFIQAGGGKLNNIAPVVDFFTSLGIPFPQANAYLVGGVEFIGGWCLLLGLFSRVIVIPLIITMVTAYFTAHKEATYGMLSALGEVFQNMGQFRDYFSNFMEKAAIFVKESPFNFLLTSLVVFCFGPGCIALDCVLGRVFFGKRRER